jgi:signal peptidase I
VTRVLSSIMLGGVIVLIAITVGGMMLGLWRFAVIDTGSMRPTLDPGDVAILTSEPTADLRKGQSSKRSTRREIPASTLKEWALRADWWR